MQYLIVAFGLFILITAGLLIVRPAAFTAFMLKNADRSWLHLAAVGVRLALGILPGLFLVIASLVLLRYRINRDRFAEARRVLESRRTEPPSQPPAV